MDCPCANFGDFIFSRFGFIVQTDRQTDRQKHMQNDRCSHATTVGVSNYRGTLYSFCHLQMWASVSLFSTLILIRIRCPLRNPVINGENQQGFCWKYITSSEIHGRWYDVITGVLELCNCTIVYVMKPLVFCSICLAPRRTRDRRSELFIRAEWHRHEATHSRHFVTLSLGAIFN